MQIHLVTGGAGFLGSHLIDRLMEAGDEVICLDNYFTGRKANIARWIGHPRFDHPPRRHRADQAGGGPDQDLVCPASRFTTVQSGQMAKTSFLGTYNAGLSQAGGGTVAARQHQRGLRRSEVHPQPERYWGSVNPIGVRSCYDEGKRIVETLCFDCSA